MEEAHLAAVTPNLSGVRGRIEAAAAANGVPKSSLIACADAADGLQRNADIEDLFTVPDYLRLYNWAFKASLSEGDLVATDQPLIQRIEEVRGAFDHAMPAHALTRRREEFFSSVESDTVDRFRQLFAKLNETVQDGDG